jgi:5-methylcytosine-specific restriction endonuclease McrBC regulatory subunit McrC
MYVYSKSYETRFIWLLYPQVKDLKNTKIYYKTFDDTEIRAFFVNLEHIKTSIAELKRIVESHIQSPV